MTANLMADDSRVERLIELAKEEDLGSLDATASMLPNPDRLVEFRLLAKQPCVLAGRAVSEKILRAYDVRLRIAWQSEDGDAIPLAPRELAVLTGPLGSVLSMERVLLNFLQRLCGTATLTRRFVEAVAGTGADIYDTRKTLPGWRILDKYAVRCGGGRNHRFGLSDAVLIKDNHLASVDANRIAPDVFDMLNRLPANSPAAWFIEVEASAFEQLEPLLGIVGIHAILLDNFSVADLQEAVRLRDALGLKGKVQLEASGGITLANVRAVAETGVERISVGAITHSAPAVDLCLERS